MAAGMIPTGLYMTMREEYIEQSYEKYEYLLKGESMPLIADGIWRILSEAHDDWLKQYEARRLIHHSEECANWLNAGVRLELAGPIIYNAWARKFQRRYSSLKLPLKKTLDVTGFDNQMAWMEEINFDQPPLMNSIFVTKRRLFVEDAMLSGKGSLFKYMLDQFQSEDQNFLYRQTRQIILANGGGAPIDW